jgi:hypothetical protein
MCSSKIVGKIFGGGSKPKPPPPPPPPPTPDKAVDRAVQSRRKSERKRAQGAAGRKSTILAGAQGVGQYSGQQQGKTLLGQ